MALSLRSFVKWLGDWRQLLTSSTADRVAINSDVRSRKAYELLEANYERIRTEVLGRLRPHLQSPYALDSRSQEIGELIERIELGVPPNETGMWPNTAAATMADIWNAAWSCKTYRFTQDSGSEFDEYLDMLFQLTLKAIEASYVHSTFGPLVNR